MTTPIIPDFILSLFQNEVNKIVQSEIKRLCEMYSLNFEEVKGKMGLVELNTTEFPEIRIMKKSEKIAPKDERCIARMLHELEVKQCSRKQKEDGLCGKHFALKANNKLKYGTIKDPLPDELRPEVLNEKKITKIY